MNKTEINEKKHFDMMARDYDSNYGYNQAFTIYKIDGKVDKFVSSVKKKFGNKKISIIEIGCGTGEYTKRYASKLQNAQIVGLDISEEVLKIAGLKTNSANVKYVNKSAYDTREKPRTYDVVCAFYALHHLNLNRSVKEIDRILKPNGIVYFYEPNILNPIVYIIKSGKAIKKIIGDSPDEWGISPLSLKKTFKNFKILKLGYSGFIPPIYFLPFGFVRLLDIILENIKYVPLLKMLGGSVEVLIEKNEQK